MNVRDVAYGYAVGFNDSSGKEPMPYLSDMGTLKAVIDDGTSNLSIILTDNGSGESGKQVLTEYSYTYEAKEITDSVTTSITSGETTIKTTKTFNKFLIDAVYNSDGKRIMKAVYSDESKGIVSHYLDENGNKIYIDGGYKNE